MNRRDFLVRAALAGSLPAVLPIRSRAQGDVNSEIRLALIGCGDRGNSLLGSLGTAVAQGCKARLAMVCDADLARARQTAAKHGNLPLEQDYRRVLERKDIDAVIVATPNHLHCLVAISACLAGKDTYVEKPLSHCVAEGRVLADVVARTRRVVQCGLQHRSDTGLNPTRDFVKEGSLGRLLAVHAFWYRIRHSIGKVAGPTPIPPDVDYNLYCGPRPVTPLMRKNLHYDWHWQRPYGNGEFGNSVVHQIDHTHHLLGIKTPPTAVRSFGGRFLWDDDGETPNTLLAAFTYPGFEAVPYTVEICNLPLTPAQPDMAARFLKKTVGTFLLFEDGHVFFDRGGGYAADKDGKRIRKFPGDAGAKHLANFLECVAARKPGDLNCPVEEAHRSSVACHLADISHVTGTGGHDLATLENDPPPELARATEARAGFKEHLGVHNIDFRKYPLRVGAALRFNPETERFAGSDEATRQANALLADSYRAPFTLPG